MRTVASLMTALVLMASGTPAHAHHGQNFFATATADTIHPGQNVTALQGAYFRPDLGPSTGQRMELTPMYLRGMSEDFHLETHLHWMTNPAEGLNPAEGVLEGFAIGGRHRLPDFGSAAEEFPFRLAVGAQLDVPTVHAMKTLGSGPGGIFHLIISRSTSGGITFAANLSSSVFAHLACVAEPAFVSEAPARQHAHLEPAACSARVPEGEFEWGFAFGLRKNLAGNLDAGAEFAREVEYPPGMKTIIGFYWSPEPEWFIRWGVAFRTGFEADLISLRFGAALTF